MWNRLIYVARFGPMCKQNRCSPVWQHDACRNHRLGGRQSRKDGAATSIAVPTLEYAVGRDVWRHAVWECREERTRHASVMRAHRVAAEVPPGRVFPSYEAAR